MDARVRAKPELELTIHRSFDAPRSLVFKAWTDPQHLAQWSCPQGFAMIENRGELRVGGSFAAYMRSPAGAEHRLQGVYREIAPPERLVFTHAWLDASGKPGPQTLVTVILTERDGRTDMSFHQSGFDSQGSRDGHRDGWSSCFELLARLLATLPQDAAA